MAGVSEENFVTTLSEIGFKIPVRYSYNWLIEHENTKEFIEWFCENVDSSNYLSADELKEYNEIESSGNTLEGEELDKAIAEWIPGYAELDGKENECINELKSELFEAQNHSMLMITTLNKITDELCSVRSKTNELKAKNSAFKNKFVKAQQKCFGVNASLDLGLIQLGKNIEDLVKYSNEFSGGIRKSQFVSEFPIQSYIDESALFECQVHNYIDELKSSTNFQQNLKKDNWDLELKKFTKGSQFSRLLRLKEESERKGLECACDFINGILKSREIQTLASNPGIVREKLLEAKRKIKNMKQELGDVRNSDTGADHDGAQHVLNWGGWWNKAQEAVKALVWHQCSQLECVQHEIMFMEKHACFKALKGVVDVLSAQYAKDVVWMMILGEEVTRIMNMSEMASSGADFLRSEQRERFQRMVCMKLPVA